MGGNTWGWFALRYRPGTPYARRHPHVGRGRYKSREEAERLRAVCAHKDQIEVVDLRDLRGEPA